jgi:hypothetical protein
MKSGIYLGVVVALATTAVAATAAEVSFERDVLPILARRCAICHSGDRTEGDFSIATRDRVIQGGSSGPAIQAGRSGESLLVHLVSGTDRERLMPAKGPRLTDRQIEILRQWIDQGVTWKAGVTLTPAMGLADLELRMPPIPETANTGSGNPIDRLLHDHFAKQGIAIDDVVSDRIYARRVYLDLIGLLPTPAQLAAFEADNRSDKRARLVEQLLNDRTNYATHWLTFWNDLLRNSYRGTGFIDRNRTQITAWLYAALYDNLSYDEFVRQLIAPNKDSEGFARGIAWRGVVNASQRRELQAAQSVSQVFLGINLKCASCHDSFVDPWKLSDAYSLAAVFADENLEIHECDKSTGDTAAPSFLFPELGRISSSASRPERQRELASLITAPENGRFSRTIVNRLWSKFFGRGIIATLDNMDEAPFDADLLDWLAADFVQHGYDIKRTVQLICTSRAYQLPAVAPGAGEGTSLRGPMQRRMSAEQFVDSVSQITGIWQTETKEMTKADSRGQGGQLKAVRGVLQKRRAPERGSMLIRAALVDADPLQTGLGRPNREQVVTQRESIATPLEALEFTNGKTLDNMLRQGAEQMIAQELTPAVIVNETFTRALGRAPSAEELEVAVSLIGSPATRDGVQDFLWTVIMLPEFQFIE